MPRQSLPRRGFPADEALARLEALRTHDLPADGRAFAFVYDAGDAVRELSRRAVAAFAHVNGLDPTVYPSARALENRAIGACLALAQAPETARGTITAGGTESVLLAVKAARDWARVHRPAVRRPAVLLPETAHACFHKAAEYLGLDVVAVPVDASMRADVAAARRRITEDVVLVVGSAPSYAHGVIDPIAELAALAAERGILMHVDACVGGFVLPFLREDEPPPPPWDFSVPGVTSVSLDLHKHGCAPKGVSALLTRDAALRAFHYFACGRWSGYTIVNTTSLGSKSVAALAAAVAVLEHLGFEGYRERARRMVAAARRIAAAIEATPTLRLLAQPDANLLAFTPRAGDPFELIDRLAARGWMVQPAYAYGSSPAHVHLTIDPTNSERADTFVRDLVEAARDLPPPEPPSPPMLAMLEAIADGEAASAIDVGAVLAALGVEDGRLPGRAAPIHRLLDAASPPIRERLLVLFVGELFS